MISEKKDRRSPPPAYEESIKVNPATALTIQPLLAWEKSECGSPAPINDDPVAPVQPVLQLDDPWESTELDHDANAKAWSELDWKGRLWKVVVCYIGKPIALVGLLYMFVCSLNFLSSSFRLLGGRTAGEVFQSNEIIKNPIAGLMIGILATVLVQSSSTSTSIVVTMVASGILQVRPAIPIIMGANIGTSVTNTIVSLGQSTSRNEFRRAFAGATVHDMFNWLAVLVLLPLEILTGYLYHLTTYLTRSMQKMSVSESVAKHDFLKKLTKPFTNLVIQLDKKVMEAWATGNKEYANLSLIKHWCKHQKQEIEANITLFNVTVDGEVIPSAVVLQNVTKKIGIEPCSFLFHDTGLDDVWIGLILLVISLFILCSCLVLMVKILHSVLRGRIAKVIKKVINANFPGKMGFLTGYIAIFVGAGMTILVQSSSVFTSALTPLVGIGVIRLERMYPLTLGSNIGTTATSLLAAMASSSDRLPLALQVALCHLFFNISGILLFYPIPLMRLPIKMAKVMGNTTANYRWFAIMYLLLAFFLVPGAVFALSMLGTLAMTIIFSIVLFIFLFVIFINILKKKQPNAFNCLPEKLRPWGFLPEFMRSLEPLDRAIITVTSCCRRAFPVTHKPVPTAESGHPCAPVISDCLIPLTDSINSSATSSIESTPAPSRMGSKVYLNLKSSHI